MPNMQYLHAYMFTLLMGWTPWIIKLMETRVFNYDTIYFYVHCAMMISKVLDMFLCINKNLMFWEALQRWSFSSWSWCCIRQCPRSASSCWTSGWPRPRGTSPRPPRTRARCPPPPRGWPSSRAACRAAAPRGPAAPPRAANRLIGEVVQSRRRPLLGPSTGWKRLS